MKEWCVAFWIIGLTWNLIASDEFRALGWHETSLQTRCLLILRSISFNHQCKLRVSQSRLFSSLGVCAGQRMIKSSLYTKNQNRPFGTTMATFFSERWMGNTSDSIVDSSRSKARCLERVSWCFRALILEK